MRREGAKQTNGNGMGCISKPIGEKGEREKNPYTTQFDISFFSL